jgi:hypothetical protein
VVLGTFALALPYLWRPTLDSSTDNDSGTPKDVRGGLDAGRRALAQGKFHVARRLLAEVAHERERQPGLLTPALHRELNQLQRQAELLSRLCLRSPADIVRHARLVRDPQEWVAQFGDDYRGRSIVFDDFVRHDEDGRPRLGFAVEVGDEPIRMALEDLTVLRDLPLDDGLRLIFGARLAGCLREKDGIWVIRFEKDSGVLFTDAAAVEACFPFPVSEGLEETLQRQQRWLDDRAGALPARP